MWTRLPRAARLRTGADIRDIIRKGRRIGAGPYVVHGRPTTGSAGSRIAVVVPRRVGAPVVRNRIKRTFREAFRMSRADWRRSWDVVVYVRSMPRPVTMQRANRVLTDAIAALELAHQAEG